MRSPFWTIPVLLNLAAFFAPSGSAQSGAAAPVSAEISADLGTCSALITVTGSDLKPVYAAKMATRIRYGPLGVKKLDLEAFTGADGQLKITESARGCEEAYVYNHQQRWQTGDGGIQARSALPRHVQRGIEVGKRRLRFAPYEHGPFHRAPTGREADFGLVPRTALRLSWAIILRPLRGVFLPCGMFISGVTRRRGSSCSL